MNRLLRIIDSAILALGALPTDEGAMEIYRTIEYRRDESTSLREQLSADDLHDAA